ncbi:MAG: RadC family protein [Desulfotomaculales bacterium]
METLWDDGILRKYRVGKKSLAQTIREKLSVYRVSGTFKSEGLAGILAALLGDIPDETLNALLAGGVRGLAQMAFQELMHLRGIGKDRALRLLAAVELAKMISTAPPQEMPVIKNPGDAARLVMGEMRQLDREHFWVLLLNTKNQVIAREVISIGTLNSSRVHPREVFKNAIKQSAAAMILVHNHPSGDPSPSREDIEVTRCLVEAGRIVDIAILDHLIVGDNRFVSFKEKGLI